MKPLIDQLAGYAAYHRDSRNIGLHLIGVPMIVVAVEILLARPAVTIGGGGGGVTLAAIASAIAALFYLRLDVRFGLTLAVLLALAAWLGSAVAREPRPLWLGLGIGLFAIGWAIQVVGHVYEGRKPAFLDDLSGLLVGPLFVVAEVAFLLGLRRDLRDAVTERA